MPADDFQAMPSPPADEHDLVHSSPLTTRYTCPPEDLRIHPPSSHNAIIDAGESPLHVPTQQPTPPPQDATSPARSNVSSESQPKPVGAPIEGPIRDIPTPMSAVDDHADEPRNLHASPLSATAPALVPWLHQQRFVSPYANHRVCAI